MEAEQLNAGPLCLVAPAEGAHQKAPLERNLLSLSCDEEMYDL